MSCNLSIWSKQFTTPARNRNTHYKDGPDTAKSFERSRALHSPLKVRKFAPSSSRPRNASHLSAQHLRLCRITPNPKHPSSSNRIFRVQPLPYPPPNLRLGHLVRLHLYAHHPLLAIPLINKLTSPHHSYTRPPETLGTPTT